MARTINKVELLGRVGADPEMKYTQSGTAITQLRLATDWHSITCWSGLAEAVNQYVAKGDRLYVAGKLAQNSYETEDGQRRHRTEIHASEVVFLDSRNGGSSEEESAVASAEEPVKAKSPF